MFIRIDISESANRVRFKLKAYSARLPFSHSCTIKMTYLSLSLTTLLTASELRLKSPSLANRLWFFSYIVKNRLMFFLRAG
jgi:hypothetical protein